MSDREKTKFPRFSWHEIIFLQMRGFFRTRQTPPPPRDHEELIVSRVIAALMVIFTFWFVIALWDLEFIPVRIYIRAALVALPLLVLALKFWRGISISWILRGCIRYWLVPLLYLFTYYVLMNIFYHIFTGKIRQSSSLFLDIGLFLLILSGILIVYFLKLALYRLRGNRGPDHSLPASPSRLRFYFYLACAICWLPFLAGGIISLLTALGIISYQ